MKEEVRPPLIFLFVNACRKLLIGAIGQKVCVKTDITVDISIVMSV